MGPPQDDDGTGYLVEHDHDGGSGQDLYATEIETDGYGSNSDDAMTAAGLQAQDEQDEQAMVRDMGAVSLNDAAAMGAAAPAALAPPQRPPQAGEMHVLVTDSEADSHHPASTMGASVTSLEHVPSDAMWTSGRDIDPELAGMGNSPDTSYDGYRTAWPA